LIGFIYAKRLNSLILPEKFVTLFGRSVEKGARASAVDRIYALLAQQLYVLGFGVFTLETAVGRSKIRLDRKRGASMKG
jgi:hypothetical protein